MKKLTRVHSDEYLVIAVRFDDGVSGLYSLSRPFTGIADPLNDPRVFATAHMIDDGMGIGFDGCEYDICAQAVYETVTSASSVGTAAA